MAMICMGCGKECVEHFDDPLTLRAYCAVCASNEKTSSRGAFMVLLDRVLPLGTGVHVECRTAGVRYDGNGVIVGVSHELADGGTPVHPAYLVNMDDSAESVWYTEICLTRINE